MLAGDAWGTGAAPTASVPSVPVVPGSLALLRPSAAYWRRLTPPPRRCVGHGPSRPPLWGGARRAVRPLASVADIQGMRAGRGAARPSLPPLCGGSPRPFCALRSSRPAPSACGSAAPARAPAARWPRAQPPGFTARPASAFAALRPPTVRARPPGAWFAPPLLSGRACGAARPSAAPWLTLRAVRPRRVPPARAPSGQGAGAAPAPGLGRPLRGRPGARCAPGPLGLRPPALRAPPWGCMSWLFRCRQCSVPWASPPPPPVPRPRWGRGRRGTCGTAAAGTWGARREVLPPAPKLPSFSTMPAAAPRKV